MSYTYIEPTKPQKPFSKGEIVEVMNADHSICGGPYKVTRAGKTFAQIADGRRFRQADGYWIGDNGAYPFPWLRHAATATPDTHWACACTRRQAGKLQIKLNPKQMKRCRVCGSKRDTVSRGVK